MDICENKFSFEMDIKVVFISMNLIFPNICDSIIYIRKIRKRIRNYHPWWNIKTTFSYPQSASHISSGCEHCDLHNWKVSTLCSIPAFLLFSILNVAKLRKVMSFAELQKNGRKNVCILMVRLSRGQVRWIPNVRTPSALSSGREDRRQTILDHVTITGNLGRALICSVSKIHWKIKNRHS